MNMDHAVLFSKRLDKSTMQTKSFSYDTIVSYTNRESCATVTNERENENADSANKKWEEEKHEHFESLQKLQLQEPEKLHSSLEMENNGNVADDSFTAKVDNINDDDDDDDDDDGNNCNNNNKKNTYCSSDNWIKASANREQQLTLLQQQLRQLWSDLEYDELETICYKIGLTTLHWLFLINKRFSVNECQINNCCKRTTSNNAHESNVSLPQLSSSAALLQSLESFISSIEWHMKYNNVPYLKWVEVTQKTTPPPPTTAPPTATTSTMMSVDEECPDYVIDKTCLNGKSSNCNINEKDEFCYSGTIVEEMLDLLTSIVANILCCLNIIDVSEGIKTYGCKEWKDMLECFLSWSECEHGKREEIAEEQRVAWEQKWITVCRNFDCLFQKYKLNTEELQMALTNLINNDNVRVHKIKEVGVDVDTHIGCEVSFDAASSTNECFQTRCQCSTRLENENIIDEQEETKEIVNQEQQHQQQYQQQQEYHCENQRTVENVEMKESESVCENVLRDDNNSNGLPSDGVEYNTCLTNECGNSQEMEETTLFTKNIKTSPFTEKEVLSADVYYSPSQELQMQLELLTIGKSRQQHNKALPHVHAAEQTRSFNSSQHSNSNIYNQSQHIECVECITHKQRCIRSFSLPPASCKFSNTEHSYEEVVLNKLNTSISSINSCDDVDGDKGEIDHYNKNLNKININNSNNSRNNANDSNSFRNEEHISDNRESCYLFPSSPIIDNDTNEGDESERSCITLDHDTQEVIDNDNDNKTNNKSEKVNNTNEYTYVDNANNNSDGVTKIDKNNVLESDCHKYYDFNHNSEHECNRYVELNEVALESDDTSSLQSNQACCNTAEMEQSKKDSSNENENENENNNNNNNIDGSNSSKEKELTDIVNEASSSQKEIGQDKTPPITATENLAQTSTTKSVLSKSKISPTLTFHLESREDMIRRRLASPQTFFAHHQHQQLPPSSSSSAALQQQQQQMHQTQQHNVNQHSYLNPQYMQQQSQQPQLPQALSSAIPPSTVAEQRFCYRPLYANEQSNMSICNSNGSMSCDNVYSCSFSSQSLYQSQQQQQQQQQMHQVHTSPSLLYSSPNANNADMNGVLGSINYNTTNHETNMSFALSSSTSPPRSLPISPLVTFAKSSQCLYDYILVLDFEATCEENTPLNYCYEIIEFPVVVVDVKAGKVVGEFHRFVKPRYKSNLSNFCKALTGISQSTIDSASPLEDVITEFEEWYKVNIPANSSCVFATDGPADLKEFMFTHSVMRQGIRFPLLFYSYIDVKQTFAHFFHCAPGKIKVMLDVLHLPMLGRLHSGLDDARNIARIVLALLQWGCNFNELPLNMLPYSEPQQHHSHQQKQAEKELQENQHSEGTSKTFSESTLSATTTQVNKNIIKTVVNTSYINNGRKVDAPVNVSSTALQVESPIQQVYYNYSSSLHNVYSPNNHSYITSNE